MSRNNHGVLLGFILALLVAVIALVGWLYGSKIKEDISNKLTNQTEQSQQTQQNENELEDSNLYISLN